MQSPTEHQITLPLVDEKEENICLPLVINVVSKYWGEEISLEEIQQAAKKYTRVKGSIMMEGIELAENHGLVSYIYKGSLTDIKKRIDQAIPPIVILPGIHETVQHAIIISGYDPQERRILTYIPKPDTFGAIPEARFDQDWEQDDRITILLVPKDMKNLVENNNDNLPFLISNRKCFEAERLRQQGRIDEAIHLLKSAIERDNNNPQGWCLLGGLYNELDREEAIGCYEKTISLNPRYYIAFRGLGNYYLKKKDYANAERYYTAALEINPARFAPIYKNRAVARLQLGNTQGAKTDLVDYLEHFPNAADKSIIQEAISEIK